MPSFFVNIDLAVQTLCYFVYMIHLNNGQLFNTKVETDKYLFFLKLALNLPRYRRVLEFKCIFKRYCKRSWEIFLVKDCPLFSVCM
jgi:hypothetical protein